MEAVRRQQKLVLDGFVVDSQAGFAAEGSRQDTLQRDAAEVLVAADPGVLVAVRAAAV